MSCTITASAPGSLMLLGEHAVLHGHRSLVCAINRRISVKLTARSDGAVSIDSALGKYESDAVTLADDPAFRFVLQAIRSYGDKITDGFDLKISSEFSSEIGFGSSAAVTVATHAALTKWTSGRAPTPDMLFKRALATVLAVQGRGSGSDLAASVFGGAVAYRITPEFDPVECSLPLTAVYCGYKTPTPEVIATVEALRLAEPEKYERIYTEIDSSVSHAIVALRDGDVAEFGRILNRNQTLMEQMGVNTPELQEIVSTLQADPYMAGAKISGSGLGDCVVGLGRFNRPLNSYPMYSLKITPVGFNVALDG